MSNDARHNERKLEIELQALRQKIVFLQARLSAEIERRSLVEKLLHEALKNHYYDEYKVSASWLRDALGAAFPPIEGERR